MEQRTCVAGSAALFEPPRSGAATFRHLLVTTSSSSARPPPPAPAAPPAKRGPLVELGIGAAWIIGLGAACQMAAVALHSNPLAVIMVQAVAVDLAVGRAGLKWDPEANDNTATERRNAMRGIGIGAGVGLAVIALVLGVSAALGWAAFSAHGPTTSLALGGMRSIAIGVRDAQLFAGLPVYFVGRALLASARGGATKAPGASAAEERAGSVSRVSAVVFSALLGGAALALMPAATPANVALAMSVTGATAALWSRDGAGWAAVGLLGGWTFLAGAVFRGGLVDVAWSKGALAPGVVADGAPAWIASALFVAVAIAALRVARKSAGEPPA